MRAPRKIDGRSRRGAAAEARDPTARSRRYEKKLADARANAQAIARQDARQADGGGRRAPQDARSQAQPTGSHEAEKTIARPRPRRWRNVRGIATEAAAAIVERLIGQAKPDTRRVADAVDRSAEALEGCVMHILMEAEFWVAVAFVIFLGVLALCRRAQDDPRHARQALGAHQVRARRGASAERRGARSCSPNIRTRRGEAEREAAGDHRRRQGGCRAARCRGRCQAGGFHRPPHQDGGNQDRARPRRRRSPMCALPPPKPRSPRPRRCWRRPRRGKIADG